MAEQKAKPWYKRWWAIIILIFIGLIFISFLLPDEDTQNSQNSISDVGDFKVIYSSTSNSDYLELEKIFKESRLFEEVANELNDILILPQDIEIVLGECGETNAFYNPENRQIVMCYELIEELSSSFSDVAESEEELGSAIIHSTLFIFYHEMGHALVDVLDIPITGKEEDAVDQLSSLILIEAGEEGESAVLDGASWFFLRGEESKITELALADEHALDKQRFYNLVCWVYGKDPTKNTHLIRYISGGRAERCPQKYSQIFNSWERLTEPYTK